MDAMLLADGDDSSEDEDNKQQQQQPPPAPPQPQGNHNQRLKSLYSPAAQQQAQRQQQQQQQQRRGLPPPPGHHRHPSQPQQPPQPGGGGSSNMVRQSSGISNHSSNSRGSSSYGGGGGMPPQQQQPMRPPQHVGPPPGRQSSAGSNTNDPFAPTPVSQMRDRSGSTGQRSRHAMVQQQQQQPSHRSSYPPMGSGSKTNNISSAANPAPPLGRGGVMPPPPQQQQQQGYHPQQQQHRPRGSSGSTSTSSTMPASNRTGHHPGVSTGSSSGGGSRSSNNNHPNSSSTSAREAAVKKQKETFLMFTRVLIKYLEQKDPPLHQQVKAIIKECADRNKNREPGYESVTASMKARLKQVVNETYWQRAEAYLRQLVNQRKQQQQHQSSQGRSSSSGRATQGQPSQPQQQAPKQGQRQQQQQPLRPPPQARTLMQGQQPGGAPVGSGGGGQAPQTGVSRSVSAVRKDISAARQSAQAKHQQAKASSGGYPGSSAGGGGNSSNRPGTGGMQAQPPNTVAGATTTTVTATSKKGGTKRSTSKSGTSAASRKAASAKSTASSKASSATAVSAPTMAMVAPAVLPPAAAAVPLQPERLPQEVIKPYQVFYETLDHAVNLQDWQQTPLVLGHKTHAALTDEQHQMLYHQPTPPSTAVPPSPSPDGLSFPRPGWGETNVVGVRNAWAKVRLREKKFFSSHHSTSTSVPAVLDIPEDPQGRKIPLTTWYNEDVAEDDKTLAALSEGAQLYLKSILEKAIYCARQRQNVDGIRLWHTQVMHAMSSKTSSTTASENTKDEPPALVLRLGCDVQRQVARTQANAALVNQRMEEALERQSGLSEDQRVLTQTTLEAANSMSEVALRPRLSRGVDDAEVEAARFNEVAGGKHVLEDPPLGRVPKQAKLEVVDFQNGMQMTLRPGRHRASVVSGAFAF